MITRLLQYGVAISAMLADGVGAQLPVDLPEPTGRFAVGTRRFEWVDSSRAEIAGIESS